MGPGDETRLMGRRAGLDTGDDMGGGDDGGR
jgi:hypothetical protein